ncbi:50S ribosomal protein L11 methyltransferase [Merismopedia glauca CCAP 1448/3]|uniref:Ribosomal protein L11 methyltransferase n=2 Tax=Merismopedia TaxID=53402 RepID=A0A2T1C823_9CYAN|nr:50S ribosomal protein L11 methyltransferase [Merismopedia glauca CCAP 1448/3]
MNNSWWEIEISCDLGLEELIFWRLEQFGCRGTATESQTLSLSKAQGVSGKIKTYVPVEQVELSDLTALSEKLRQDALLAEFSPPSICWQIVYEEDWASSWKEYWQPQEIGSKLVIYPAWLPVPANIERQVLRLDPGMAFGTGTHQTTQLCLEALERHLKDAESDLIIADLGCGSGILGIYAIILGADRVYAVDTDPLAVSATQTNRHLNQIDPVRLLVETGSIEKLQEILPKPVDGFVCNILAEVIIELIPHFEAITKPTAWGSLSGIILDQVPAVTEVLERYGWKVVNTSYRQDWCCLDIQRQ